MTPSATQQRPSKVRSGAQRAHWYVQARRGVAGKQRIALVSSGAANSGRQAQAWTAKVWPTEPRIGRIGQDGPGAIRTGLASSGKAGEPGTGPASMGVTHRETAGVDWPASQGRALATERQASRGGVRHGKDRQGTAGLERTGIRGADIRGLGWQERRGADRGGVDWYGEHWSGRKGVDCSGQAPSGQQRQDRNVVQWLTLDGPQRTATAGKAGTGRDRVGWHRLGRTGTDG